MKTRLSDTEAILKAMIERESLGTTAVGRAGAFPRADLVIGTSPEGIDFGAPGAEPVRFVALHLLQALHGGLSPL